MSVLVVGACSGTALDEARQLAATTELAAASLAGVSREILVLARSALYDDARALVRDLGARLPQCEVIEDRAAWPLALRVERLIRRARGQIIVLLQDGAMACGDALRRLVAAVEQGASAARPRAVDADGEELSGDIAAGACLVFRRAQWPNGLGTSTPYRTHAVFAAFARELGAVDTPGATVVTAGRAGLPGPARGAAWTTFDQQLAARRVPVAGSTSGSETAGSALVVMLRTLGDCVLATPILSTLHQRWPGTRLCVLTEARYAWIFTQHPAVAEVLTTDIDDGDLFWREDLAITAALHARTFDRLIVLSDRLDHVTYHHSGRSLQATYFAQAGCDQGLDLPGEVFLPPPLLAERDAALADLGLAPGAYAVLHARAGWPEKSLPQVLVATIVNHLWQRHHLRTVLVGGEPEPGLAATALDLGGRLSMAESAAFIAGARVFVGCDSGPLHLASAFSVPSLALYAGSAIRVAPPTAHGSRAIQSPSSCTLPCGVTPCKESACGFADLEPDTVLDHLDRLLAGAPDAGDFRGAEPACYARARDGLHLLPGDHAGDAMFAAALIAAPDACARHRSVARQGAAPIRRLECDSSPAALLAHARAALADGVSRSSGEVLRASAPRLRVADLDRLSLHGRVAAAFTLVNFAAQRRQPLAELRAAGETLDLLCRVCHGDSERARPAARQFVDEAVRRYLRAAVAVDPSGLTLAIAVRRSQEMTGATPADEALLAALLSSSDITAAARTMQRDLLAIGKRAGLPHGARLGLAQLLWASDAPDAAEQILAQELQSFDAGVDPTTHGQTLLARALLRARDPQRLHAACLDAERAHTLLQGTRAGVSARELMLALQRHARGAVAQSSDLPPSRPAYVAQRSSSTTESSAPAR